MLDIASPVELTVQPHGVTNLVDQLNAIDSPRAARRAAYFVHELEQDARALIRRQTQAWIHTEMQNSKALVRGTNENGDAHRPSFVGNREQGLDSVDVADTDPQTAVLLIDFGHAIGIDGLLNADSYAMLVYVEKQQLLQGWTLLRS
jgi:hypothetical protein